MDRKTFKKYVKPISKGLCSVMGGIIGYATTSNEYGTIFAGGAGAVVGDVVVDWIYKDFND